MYKLNRQTNIWDNIYVYGSDSQAHATDLVIDNKGNIIVVFGNSLIFSSDSGNTWKEIQEDKPSNLPALFTFFDGQNKAYYLHGATDIYTYNFGDDIAKYTLTTQNWDATPLKMINDKNGNFFFLFWDATLYKSTNRGASWRGLIRFKLADDSFSRDLITDNNSNIYVCTDEGSFISIDSGNSWSGTELVYANTSCLWGI